ncbi:CRISPR-associated endoribonuclease Cas6 [Brachyspira catarrhinii]|uniref:CRISPR-associated endoribonuclease Cas6 n=1 Tax=Brachyspira catarrhinii TaxID=2528966 RepID=A0ABY2TTG6_9SPIR|nr:CRISPR-associated endoribonuclease Cas6 [Brachyspira catarrhinii]TKZ36100.1 CRISPR-associated endoribonuclease Cas6 [Brachyspira catarrhinii]
MRIKLHFELENKIIPKDYRILILSFIKNSLGKNFEKSYKEIYESKPIMKFFTFSVYLPKPKIEKDKIELDKNYFNAVFSIYDNKRFIEFYNSFNSMIIKNNEENEEHSYPLKDNKMILKNITMLNEKIITSNRAIIKFLSPLVVRKHEEITINEKRKGKDIYLDFNDSDFNEQLNYSVTRLIKDLKLDGVNSNIKLEPCKSARKTVVDFKDVSIHSSIGEYIISGESALLNILYKTGIGGRRGEGFGMFDVIKELKSEGI